MAKCSNYVVYFKKLIKKLTVIRLWRYIKAVYTNSKRVVTLLMLQTLFMDYFTVTSTFVFVFVTLLIFTSVN